MFTDPGGVSVTLDSEHMVHESTHADPLGEKNQPSITPDKEFLALQVQVFLEASEDVDVDAETIEDILDVLVDDDKNDEPEDPLEVGMHDYEDEDEDSHDGENLLSQIVTNLPEEITESEPQGEIQVWTKQEIKQMIHLLKERGSSAFIDEYVRTRNIPIPKLLEAFGIKLCPELHGRRPKTMLYFLRVAMSHQLRNRDKLSQYNTVADAVQLIRQSQRILILTGAGISVSCGIPDFRSRDGLYASLKSKGEYELDDPQQMFDIRYFKENPSVFYSFASQIYPSNFVPSPCHRFIKAVEDQGKLLRNYTQNIDTLETLAGVQRVLQCHGSFATATCLECRQRVPGTDIEADILSRKVPLCKICNTVSSAPIKSKGKKSKKKAKGQWDSDVEDESDGPEYPPSIMKPDITFFGEKLTDDFDNSLAEDRFKVDLLLVIGTSLKILINKTPIRHINPDIVLLGNSDDIVLYLSRELGWELPAPRERVQTSANNLQGNGMRLQPPRGNLKKRPSADESDSLVPQPPERVGER
ncbi:hypothetical protein M413DRAFT_363794 [Hebeloma cylindrosporum]|uniref:Deacetylase sirtuin-type domain-containing protein n=1 Tax=Hebeloma cylindrosporum TaxID=76867 RepID=A0A0C3CL31_HEBCY|nr:hypothetical protein M413DRAFT_363794 [Hebeloma cylindrosporum h7]